MYVDVPGSALLAIRVMFISLAESLGNIINRPQLRLKISQFRLVSGSYEENRRQTLSPIKGGINVLPYGFLSRQSNIWGHSAETDG